ncbi:MAG: AMP-binding protein [Nonomuraea sp.]|nr:AMP-binding protein [Streptomyces sp.]NUP83321.1 AMP-binding protein [Nonomuraea sp.]NUS03575.1 AMP-binding protein [Nonomuraea sp.]NUT03769.1 AMP-binding protein [Hamadaea sp.]
MRRDVVPGGPAQIIHTSGTTGRAKGVGATHANLAHGVSADPRGGAPASSVGAVIGIAFMYVLFGLVIVAITLVATRVPALARFDREVPDAVADDLVGVRALRSKEE